MHTPDPMDIHSLPLEVEQTKLSKIFTINPRRNPQKPGRELVVTYDSRFPLVEEFHNEFSYYVRFLEDGNAAGNHYHEKKQELFYPIVGEFDVTLEDPTSKERETLHISSQEDKVLYIPAGLAHVVVAETRGAVLLVMATSPNNDADEYAYQVL